MNRISKPSHFGCLVKLKYYASVSKWNNFFECADILMCINEIAIGEILHLSQNAPQNHAAEFEKKWELEIAYYFSVSSGYNIPTASSSHGYQPPHISTPRGSSDSFYKHKQMKVTTPSQLLPVIKYALESHNKIENIESIYNHHPDIFTGNIDDLPICIESYYLARAKHPLIALRILSAIYWSVRDSIIADIRDIALIVLCSRNYDLVVDFVIKNQRKIYRHRKMNQEFDQLVDPAIKEIMFEIHVSNYTQDNPPKIAVRERKNS